MDLTVTTLDGAEAGSITLADEVFGLEPRADILQRMVRWQLARRQAGTHKSKTRGEIAFTTAKMYKQKGTGRARHGAKSAPQFRKGGKAFGPVVRSHEHDLPKKVRALALRLALSAKARSADIIVVDDVTVDAPKTKALKERFARLGIRNALIVGGATVDGNFSLAARNLPQIDVLPVQGINVYDILRRDKLVLSRAAIAALEERFSGRGRDTGEEGDGPLGAPASVVRDAAETVRDAAGAVVGAAGAVLAAAGGAAASIASGAASVVSHALGGGSDTEAEGENGAEDR